MSNACSISMTRTGLGSVWPSMRQKGRGRAQEVVEIGGKEKKNQNSEKGSKGQNRLKADPRRFKGQKL